MYEHSCMVKFSIIPLTVLIFPPQNRQWGGDRVLPPSYGGYSCSVPGRVADDLIGEVVQSQRRPLLGPSPG